jgi:hypothetical protein
MRAIDVKHEMGKCFQGSFRNAVLDRYSVTREDDRILMRISYIHTKTLISLNYQYVFIDQELEGPYCNNMLRQRAEFIIKSLKAAAKEETASAKKSKTTSLV